MKVPANFRNGLLLLVLLSGCHQKPEISGVDACKNNGGLHGAFYSQTSVLWLCQDGSVRWSDKGYLAEQS